MTHLTDSFKIDKLNDLVGMDKYISHMNKWH